MLIKTYYDVMSNEDRCSIFKAYKYDRYKHIYILTNPEHLAGIKKAFVILEEKH